MATQRRLAGLLSAPRLIMLIFFLQPIAYGSWLPRIPQIQEALGIGPAELALALIGAPVGIIATLPFAGSLVARIGGRRTIFLGYIGYLALVAAPTLAPSPLFLFLALMIAGASISFLELGLNIEADRIEALSGRLIMSTCHGFWSLGLMSGNLVGAGLAALHLAPHLSLLLVAVILLPISLAAAHALPRPETAPAGDIGAAAIARPSMFARPTRAVLAVSLFVFGITMTEGAAADWAAIYMRDALGAADVTAGLFFSVFAGMVALGRFLGDRLKARFGAVALARAASAASLSGAALLAVAPNLAAAVAGFAALGLGVSVGFPLAVSAAASLGGRAPAANVAFLSLIALCGFLVGPPLIGGVTQVAGVRNGMAMVIPGLLLSLALAPSLGRRAKARAAQAG